MIFPVAGDILSLDRSTPLHILSRNHLVIALAVQDPQNGQEEVNNIKIETDSRSNLLLHMIMSHNKLRVHKNIPAKNQRSNPTPHKLHGTIRREERSHEPKNYQTPEPPEEVRHPARKVILCLAGEGRERDEDAERDDEGLDNDARIVEGGDDADGVGFEEREAGEEEEVGRVGLAFPEGEEEEADGAEEGGPH
jgi:hypothetical protein